MIKKINTQRGEMEFGMMVLLFIVAIFILWVLTGGPQKSESEKPFINPYNNSSAPLKVYGPDEKNN